jgi:hypothetical protein
MFKERELFKKILACLNTPEPVLLIGMRGVGKSTLLKQIYDKVNFKNKLFLDFENPLNQKYFEGENFSRIKSSLEILGLTFNGEKAFIFLDEVRSLENLFPAIRFFTENHRVKFFLTSSVCLPITICKGEDGKKNLSIFEVFPLNFGEFLAFKGSRVKVPKSKSDITRPIFDVISNLYDEYILFGGFPEVVLKKTMEEKKKTIEDIFSSFFKFDVVQFSSFRKSEVIRDLMLLLMQRAGQKLDVQKLAEDLNISRATAHEYISFLEKANFIKTINPISFNSNREIKKTPKVYICDTGLINSFTRISEEDLFKNSVFQNLRGEDELFYYQKKGGSQIDFVFKDTAYNVKVSPKKADLSKLKRLSLSIGINNFKVVSKNYSEYEDATYAFML